MSTLLTLAGPDDVYTLPPEGNVCSAGADATMPNTTV